VRRRTGRLGPAELATGTQVPEDKPHGEPRLPVVITLVVAMAIPFLMPDELIPASRWIVPGIILVLMVAMLVLDPGRIDRRSAQLHWLRLGILLVLAFGTAYGTVELTHALVLGSAAITNSPQELLRAGGLVWLGLLITFAFLYWELDLGGPGERAHIDREFPDLAFPQDLNPSIAPPGWQPTFVDYLYLGLTNNIAFSPTDVMPLRHWAKLAMGLQSVVSLLVLGLVIARAVNIFK
jgi:uncharacterized membrane protein